MTPRPDVTLRPATDDDAGYVDSLVLADALVELAALPDPPRSHLARVQVAARREGHLAAWPGSVDHVILLGGVRVGRLLLHRGDVAVRVVDLRLEADERRHGVGTSALGQVCADASLAGVTVTLSVRAGTPTEQWYRRLGFVDVGAPDPQAADVELVRPADG